MPTQQIINDILRKLSIDSLNEMQQAMLKHYAKPGDITLLSPTGSGKTIAFLAPLILSLKQPCGEVQALVIAPSRELVLQIFNIARSIATNHKVTCLYGGHNANDERLSLATTPSIIISTPGRLVDHISRENISISHTSTIVLDEFDKSLELGFHDEMRRIMRKLPRNCRKILTSATPIDSYPDFVQLYQHSTLNFLFNNQEMQLRMKVWRAESSDKDKLQALKMLLLSLDNKKTIVFANYRESVERIYQFLTANNISAGIYHGALEQIDREKAVAMFQNGSTPILISTDLGSRGLDIDNVGYIIHYHLPSTAQAYTHRNGRTARVDKDGEIFVITSPQESVPEFITFNDTYAIPATAARQSILPANKTLYFMAGKKEKISKGDIVGFIVNNSQLSANEIGQIDVKDHYALVAIPSGKAAQVLSDISTHKIKNKKVRINFAKVV
ncbi:MAG: DEAD/DEAH box helicase [Muribaculaceae bacterium]